MASNEEILKSIHAEKVINWNQIFRQNPTIIESAYEAMDAARRDEMDEFRKFLIGMNELFLASELKKLYTIFKQQNS